ncbi:MAG: 16S rRNA (adenine(1518)-N(6)/adenine(1519)-N(6))-dimethyltransferase RsmA [Oscillospiraceae bacterium]|nr:16S rRNA (adenine(1518)-N(6)/adenine(1519)-N(6))-dimethyltransferase RsmA [Oscillospiraceae bacterium]
MNDNCLTDMNYIKSLCGRHNFALSKGFGQNFIVNPGICPKIAEAAGIDETYGVLEIGPGIGVLTKELALRAKKVVAIEIDERLPALLAESLDGFTNVKLIMGDVLKLDLRKIISEEFGGLKVAVCANLPYYITSPIVMKLLEEKLPLEHITVMVQKEAAQRISAQPGTRDAGAISLAVRYYAQPKLLFTVQAGSFFPPPKVTSAVIQLVINRQPAVETPNETQFFKLIRAAFCQRRKTAQNSISAGMGVPKAQIAAALEQIGQNPLARPEQLTLEDFCGLQKALFAQKG